MDIKKIILLLVIIPFLLGGSFTTNYNLYKPAVDELNWGAAVNSDFDVIDRTLYTLSTDNDYIKVTVLTVLTIPVSADPDVNEVGQIAYDSNDYVLRASADVGQVALAMRKRTIQATITEPDQLDATDLLPLYSN